jgi:hypothetical protein
MGLFAEKVTSSWDEGFTRRGVPQALGCDLF